MGMKKENLEKMAKALRPSFCKIPGNDCGDCRYSVEDCMDDWRKAKLKK